MFGYNNHIVQADLQEITGTPIQWEEFQHKIILVTGANGMLATYLIYTFLYLVDKKGLDIKIIALSRSLEKTQELYAEFLNKPYFVILHQDICDPIEYNGRVDYIYHFAGNASPRFINSDPVGILQTNLKGMFNVMEFARDKEPERIIFASTREVYGAVDADVLSETSFGYLDSMDDRSCYPESKRAAESILRGYYLQYGIKGISVRIAHSYGPGMKIENDGRVMADFIGDAVCRRDIVMKSVGDAIRAFCYITDAVLGLVQVTLYGMVGEAYNLANETEPMPIREVAQMICDSFPERKIKVIFAGEQPKVGYCNYPRVALDTSKIEALGFTPKVGLKEGIYRTIKSFGE